jgi:hypothetical protein
MKSLLVYMMFFFYEQNHNAQFIGNYGNYENWHLMFNKVE